MENFIIQNLSFSYANTEEQAIKKINLRIEQGEFIVICGKSGSGKSTLLRMLKPELTPNGKVSGEIKIFNKDINDFTQKESAECIGFLLQNTEYQTVTHTVRSELAFGLENLGYDSKTIRLRIAELSAYFSLESIIDKRISELSGGQKQIVCLASIVAMHPKVVILDEPISQLDPVSSVSFLEILQKLCRENGITIIMTEHRLENVVGLADRVIIMTYEWGYTYGPPLAVAPINQVRRVVEYALTEIPGEKIDLGIPNYGYDWKLPFERGVSKAVTIGNVEAVRIAIDNGAVIEFDELSKSPFFRYTNREDGALHEVWFEDVRSMEKKFELIKEFDLRGCGYWQIMQWFRANWLLLWNQKYQYLISKK